MHAYRCWVEAVEARLRILRVADSLARSFGRIPPAFSPPRRPVAPGDDDWLRAYS